MFRLNVLLLKKKSANLSKFAAFTQNNADCLMVIISNFVLLNCQKILFYINEESNRGSMQKNIFKKL